MITRRVDVQRCPAVPTAPKKIDCVAISISALGATTSALLPPSSMMVLPSRPWTVFATFKPMPTEPVADAIVPSNDGLGVPIESLTHKAYGTDRLPDRRCRSSPALRLRLQRQFCRTPSSRADQVHAWRRGARCLNVGPFLRAPAQV